MPATRQPRARGRPRAGAGKGRRVRNQSVDRALEVFKVVAAEVAATLKVIAATVDLPASTTHRILETLHAHDMVHFDELAQTWSIGVEAFRIGQVYATSTSYLDVAREAMRQLTGQAGETSNLAVRDGAEVIHISQVETQAAIRAFIPTGSRVPLHASGIGKVLMADLDDAIVLRLLDSGMLVALTANTTIDAAKLKHELTRIRACGWAIDDEEHSTGMRCIAAPIFNEFAEAVAGLSISGPATRLTDDKIEGMAREVRAAAARITHESGGRPNTAWPASL